MKDQELPVGIKHERRKFKRFNISLVLEIKSFDKPGECSLGIIRNFSYDGFCFEFHAPDFKQEENIEFALRYPQGDLNVTFSGDVIWKEQGYTECLVGIKMKAMDQETKNRFIEIISASGNMPFDLESYEIEPAGFIGNMEKEKSAEQPGAVPQATLNLKTSQKVTGNKSGLNFLITAIVIVVLAVLSYKVATIPEKKTEHPIVIVTKKTESKAVEQVKKVNVANDNKRYDYKSIYSIQAGSFTQFARAYQQFGFVSEKLNKKELGFLRIEKIDNYYSVRLGKFDDYSAAKRFMHEITPRISDAIILNVNIEDDRIIKFYK
jgi:hypothetical protein